ncbi:MAG: hypothetical protein ACOCUI_03140 [bacterium]
MGMKCLLLKPVQMPQILEIGHTKFLSEEKQYTELATNLEGEKLVAYYDEAVKKPVLDSFRDLADLLSRITLGFGDTMMLDEIMVVKKNVHNDVEDMTEEELKEAYRFLVELIRETAEGVRYVCLYAMDAIKEQEEIDEIAEDFRKAMEEGYSISEQSHRQNKK